MKFEYGIIGVLGFMIFSIIGLIVYQPSEIPYWNYLHEIKQQHFEDGCDKDCKAKVEKRGFFCSEITSNDYVCRPPREIIHPDANVQTPSAAPVDYGEFAYFPEGEADIRMFDITHVDILNKNTGEIKVEFGYHFAEDVEKEFSYTASLLPGQTFISHCIADSGVAHLVEYLDTFELDGKTYVEFWGSHAIMPDELIPCEMPELIQYTIPIDYSLGIDFGDVKLDEPEPGPRDIEVMARGQKP